MTRTLPEELLLLVLDDRSGRPMLDTTKLHPAMAGAAIVELTLTGALELATQDGEVRRGRLRRTGLATPTDPLLAEILERSHGQQPKNAVSRVGGSSAWRNRAGTLKDQLLRQLAAEGVLRADHAKVLGLFPTTAWRPQDPSVEAGIRARVREALTAPGPPDPRTAALVGLLSATGLAPKVCPDLEKKVVTARAKEISQGDWAGEAVRKAIQEVQAAMVAAMTATMVATTSASS